MTLADGDVVPIADVERWVRDTHPYPHYLAQVTEVEQPHKRRVHVTIEITGPRGERIEHNGRRPVYTSFRDMDGMDQIDAEWVA